MLTFCFRRLQDSQAWAVRIRLSSGTLGLVISEGLLQIDDSICRQRQMQRQRQRSRAGAVPPCAGHRGKVRREGLPLCRKRAPSKAKIQVWGKLRRASFPPHRRRTRARSLFKSDTNSSVQMGRGPAGPGKSKVGKNGVACWSRSKVERRGLGFCDS